MEEQEGGSYRSRRIQSRWDHIDSGPFLFFPISRLDRLQVQIYIAGLHRRHCKTLRVPTGHANTKSPGGPAHRKLCSLQSRSINCSPRCFTFRFSSSSPLGRDVDLNLQARRSALHLCTNVPNLPHQTLESLYNTLRGRPQLSPSYTNFLLARKSAGAGTRGIVGTATATKCRSEHDQNVLFSGPSFDTISHFHCPNHDPLCVSSLSLLPSVGAERKRETISSNLVRAFFPCPTGSLMHYQLQIS